MMQLPDDDNLRRLAAASPVMEEVFVQMERLRDRDGSVRAAAAKRLMQCGDGRASEALTAALRDEDWYVRAAAAKAMGAIGDARTVGVLSVALGDSYASVREYAAEALGAIGDVRAVEPLGAAYRAKDWAGREATAQALWRIGDRTTLPLRVLAAETLTPAQKLEALEAVNGIEHYIPQSNAKRLEIFYGFGSVEGLCRKLARSSKAEAEVRRGAEAVLAELRQRAEGGVLLRASDRPESQEKQELLRGVEGGADSTAPDELLRPAGEASEPMPALRLGVWAWILKLFRWRRRG